MASEPSSHVRSASGKTVIPRNNTSFALRLFEYFRQAKWDTKWDFLKYYQNLVRIYATGVESGSRGILALLGMGMGKSILAASIAVDTIDTYQPIILLTKSLQQNMRGAIKKYVRLRGAADPDYEIGKYDDDELSAWIDKRFRFVSMNASNMLTQMNNAAEGYAADDFNAALESRLGEVVKMASLEGKRLIVDEAHNLFRAITNGSKNAIGLYDMVMKARNIKLLFLTGTPISNDPFELTPCFNMLAGTAILPESYKEFGKLFVADDGRIKNKTRFQNRLLGMVSYVTNKSSPGRAFGVPASAKAEFPDENPVVLERVNMDERQFVMYQLARDQELEEGGGGSGPSAIPRSAPEPPNMTKPKSGASSTYRVKSRQLSNWCGDGNNYELENIPVSQLGSAKYRRVVKNIDARPNQLGILYSQFVGTGGIGTFARYLEALGWTRYDAVGKFAAANGKKVGGGSAPPSVDEYLDSLESACDGTSWWSGGEIATADLLEDEPSNPSARPRVFAVITGDVPTAVREYIQDVFNSPENMHGGIIDLILLSSTGAEGLDLRHGRHVHILELYWNWARIMQIIARLVRNNSHVDMEKSERNVTPYLYLAIPPESYGTKNPDGSISYPPTTDTELYEKSIAKQVGINTFVDALAEISIECLANDESYCRRCAPTDAPLFTDDVARDVASTDPCGEAREEKVTAEEIVVDGMKYYFVRDEKALYDWRIFTRDASIDGYRPMKESDPLFATIVDAIESRPATA